MKLRKILCLLLLLTVAFSLAACKSSKKYTVIFNSDGGSAVSNQIVKNGDTVSQPADPTKDGYTFLGWYYGDEQWNFSNPISGNITLNAKWKQIEKPPVCTDHTDDNKDGKCDICDSEIVENDQDNATITINGKDIKNHVIAYDTSSPENELLAMKIQDLLVENFGLSLNLLNYNDLANENYILVKSAEKSGGEGFYVKLCDESLEIICEFPNKTLSAGE